MLYDSSRSLNSRLLPPGPNPSLSPSPHLRRQTGARESGLGTFLRCFAVRHWLISGVGAHRPVTEQHTKHTAVRLFGKTINSEPPGKQTRRKTGNQANNQTKKEGRQPKRQTNQLTSRPEGKLARQVSRQVGNQANKRTDGQPDCQHFYSFVIFAILIM